ncbi:family 16 glycosylhydrolase [Gymnodinialimonas sp. 2305UL16-5]|uniref:family 16 glycosylhydrolase n=1 Tax=Gymnodinialimonas mytili TaxID=3126503 RepID=UPI0030ADABCB
MLKYKAASAQTPARFAIPWLVVSAMLGAAPAAAQNGAAFLETFDSFDTDRWFISDGWSNGDWMNCTWSSDAVSVENGNLVLSYFEADTPSEGYLCGEIQTREEFGYGTYEVSMRTMSGSGFNAAFFTYIGPVHDQPHDEIDVEVLLQNTDEVTFNTYVSGAPENGSVASLPQASDDGFIHYAFTWSSDGIRWYVNGTEVHRTEDGVPRPANNQKIYASLWGSETFIDWMGPFDPAAVPMDLEVDWIAFTPIGGDCAFPESVLCQL